MSINETGVQGERERSAGRRSKRREVHVRGSEIKERGRQQEAKGGSNQLDISTETLEFVWEETPHGNRGAVTLKNTLTITKHPRYRAHQIEGAN